MIVRGSIALLAGAPAPPLRSDLRCSCGGAYGPLRRVSWRQSAANCRRCGSVLSIFDEID